MKSDPIHTRLEKREEAFLQELREKTGLTPAELLRRSVRLMQAHVEAKGQTGHYLVLDLVPHDHAA